MKRMIWMVLAGCAALAAVVTVVPPPAVAHDGRFDGRVVDTPQKSVFPAPRDPWRSWGVRTELPRQVGPPRETIAQEHAVRDRVWIPGHWAWDGAGWVWWPGQWGIR